MTIEEFIRPFAEAQIFDIDDTLAFASNTKSELKILAPCLLEQNVGEAWVSDERIVCIRTERLQQHLDRLYR